MAKAERASYLASMHPDAARVESSAAANLARRRPLAVRLRGQALFRCRQFLVGQPFWPCRPANLDCAEGPNRSASACDASRLHACAGRLNHRRTLLVYRSLDRTCLWFRQAVTTVPSPAAIPSPPCSSGLPPTRPKTTGTVTTKSGQQLARDRCAGHALPRRSTSIME